MERTDWSDFLQFASKKELVASKLLSAKQLEYLLRTDYIFRIHIHKAKRYVALQFYRAKEHPQYWYKILDFETNSMTDAPDFPAANRIIREIVAMNATANNQEALIGDHTSNAISPQKKGLIPRPSCDEVSRYLYRWNTTPDLFQPEIVLKKLFTETYPRNNSLADIIIKTATLNTVYNTYIYSVYPVAQHILSLDIDERLAVGDESLVNELMRVCYTNGKKKDHYSFATKYCSFHNPDAFPIYDSYVDKILQYYRNQEGFSVFKNSDLKNYPQFKCILSDFRHYFGLEKYTTKELDQYLWQFGKEFF